MKFAVLREHIGDKFYKEGDTRDADELTVKQLVRNGVLRPISDEKASRVAPIQQLQGVATGDVNAGTADSGNAAPDGDDGTLSGHTGSTIETGAAQAETLADIAQSGSGVTDDGISSGDVAVTQDGSVSAGKSDDKAELNKAEGSAPKNKAK